MATNIGIMDSAYFVGRNEILGWINDCLHLSLSRIEEVYIYLLFLHVSVINGRFVFHLCYIVNNVRDVPLALITSVAYEDLF